MGQRYFAQSGETRELTSSSSKEDVDEVLDARDSRSHSADEVIRGRRTRYCNRNEYPQRRLGQRMQPTHERLKDLEKECRYAMSSDISRKKGDRGSSLREISGKKRLPN
jgi:hypothetical protein